MHNSQTCSRLRIRTCCRRSIARRARGRRIETKLGSGYLSRWQALRSRGRQASATPPTKSSPVPANGPSTAQPPQDRMQARREPPRRRRAQRAGPRSDARRRLAALVRSSRRSPKRLSNRRTCPGRPVRPVCRRFRWGAPSLPGGDRVHRQSKSPQRADVSARKACSRSSAFT